MREGRSISFYVLATFFGMFVLFLYGPMLTIFVLSFQGPSGGLTFPLNGLSLRARMRSSTGSVPQSRSRLSSLHPT